jgi:hypothetical protein
MTHHAGDIVDRWGWCRGRSPGSLHTVAHGVGFRGQKRYSSSRARRPLYELLDSEGKHPVIGRAAESSLQEFSRVGSVTARTLGASLPLTVRRRKERSDLGHHCLEDIGVNGLGASGFNTPYPSMR